MKKKTTTSKTDKPKAPKKVREMSASELKQYVSGLAENPEFAFLKKQKKSSIKKDASRQAKPKGWRFKGDNYKKPSKAKIKEGGDDIYFESRALRSDVSSKEQLAKGGEVGYKKDWEVIGITMQGKKFKKTITLGRMSDREDVKNALRRMDLNIREVTSIKELKTYGKGGGVGKKFVRAYYNESISNDDNGYQVNLMFYENKDDDDYFDEEFITTKSPKEAEALADKINKKGYEGFMPKFGKGGAMSSFLSKAKEIGGKGLAKAKELGGKGIDKAKELAHEQKRKMAMNVINETKSKVGKSDKSTLSDANKIVKSKFAKGGGVKSPTNQEVWNKGEILDYWASDVGGSNESQDNVIEYNGKKYLVVISMHGEDVIKPNSKAVIYDEEYARGGGINKRSIKADKQRKARPQGWKKSRTTGEWYYEDRANRTDKDPKKKFARGGDIEDDLKSQMGRSIYNEIGSLIREANEGYDEKGMAIVMGNWSINVKPSERGDFWDDIDLIQSEYDVSFEVTDYDDLVMYTDEYESDGFFARGGDVNGKQYLLKSYSVDVAEDSYEEGQGNSVNGWQENVGKVYNSKQGLIDAMNNIMYTDYSESDFDWETGEGKNVQTDVLVDEDNYPASKSDKEEWKNGEKTLYNAHYFFYVLPVTIHDEYARGGGIRISDIKARTSETSPHFFDKKTMKFFGQRMSDFKTKKMPDGRIQINAPIKHDGRVIGETKRFFNPENNELEYYGKGGGVRTNSKSVREAVRKHILDSVYDYNENEFENFHDASVHLASEFHRVADHPYNKKRYPNNQERFQDYLQGIPFHFEYADYSIEEFLNSLGINPEGKEYSSEQMWRLYSYLIWREISDEYYKIS